MVSISTVLTGATPEVMDSSVTQIIEAAVNSVPGIDSIESTSQPGRSTVKVTFQPRQRTSTGVQRGSGVKGQPGAAPLAERRGICRWSKTDANGSPIVWLALTGDCTEKQLYTYANTVVKNSWKTVDGVGEVVLRRAARG